MKVSRKILLRIILILAGIWLLLLCAIYLTSGKFEAQAIKLFHNQVAKYLNTQIIIKNPGDINLTFFKNFPNASLTIKDAYILSVDEYDHSEFDDFKDHDTLMYAGKVSLVLDIWSLLSNKYVVKKIIIEDGRANILEDSKGKVNYDIFKDDTDDDSEDDVEYNMEKIILRNMQVYYIDKGLDLVCSAKIDEAEAAGSFKGYNFVIDVDARTVNNEVRYESYSFQHPNSAHTIVTINKDKESYTLSDGIARAYGIPISFKGKYNFRSRSYSYNFSLKDGSIRNIDRSLIDTYLSDLQLYPKRGYLSLNADISADSNTHNKYDLQFSIRKGELYNSRMNVGIEDLEVSGAYTNGRMRNAVSSSLKLNRMSGTSGESNFSFLGTIDNFESPHIQGDISGALELKKLMISKSLSEEFTLEGKAYGDFKVNGRIRSVDNISTRDLKNIKLEGTINLEKVQFAKKDKSIPDVTVSGRVKLKNLMQISLEDLKINTGESDFLVNGNLDNLPQFSKDKSMFPVFRGTITSGTFYLKDLMVEGDAKEEEPLHIELPDSVYLSGKLLIDNFYFDKFYATQVSSQLEYRPKILSLKDFDMNTQGGRLETSHKIEQKRNRIYTYSDINFDKLDIGDLFYAMNDFNLEIITHNNIDGTLSGTANINGAWDLELNPVFDEITGKADISLTNGELKDYQPMMGLSSFIEMEELKHIKFDKMLMEIDIRDKNLHIAQTSIKSSIFALTGSGDHRFDNSYTYKVQLRLDEVLWKKLVRRKPKNDEFGYVVDDGLGKTTIPLIISGKDTLYTVSYDRGEVGTNFRGRIKKERDEWRDLRNRKDNKEDAYKEEIRLEWVDEEEVYEEIKEQEDVKIEEYEDEDDEFIINFDPG